MDEVQQDVERSGEDDGEEEGEAGEVHVALGTIRHRNQHSIQRGKGAGIRTRISGRQS